MKRCLHCVKIFGVYYNFDLFYATINICIKYFFDFVNNFMLFTCNWKSSQDLRDRFCLYTNLNITKNFLSHLIGPKGRHYFGN